MAPFKDDVQKLMALLGTAGDQAQRAEDDSDLVAHETHHDGNTFQEREALKSSKI